MTTSLYIDPASGRTYPLDVPRWCSDDRKPLLITPQPGISRDDIDRTCRSQWRYRPRRAFWRMAPGPAANSQGTLRHMRPHCAV